MSRTEICTDARQTVDGIAYGANILIGGFGTTGMPTMQRVSEA